MHIRQHLFMLLHLKTRHIAPDPMLHTQVHRLRHILVVSVQCPDDGDVLEDEVVGSP